MNYSSIPFIFFSLFFLLCLYYLPRSLKPGWLFIGSCFWYLNWSLQWFGIFLAIITVNIALIYFRPKSKNFYPLLVAGNVLTFIALKSLPAISSLTTPYGTSFFMLIVLGMVIDFWRENSTLTKEDLLPAATMPLFFPILMAGPIERKKSLMAEFKNIQPFKIENLIDGGLIFGIGFLKKYFIVDIFGRSSISYGGFNNFIVHGLVSTFITYVLFCSYSEMGRGIARMMGIKISVSFRPFYYSKNPNDFWQRWNITLGTWMRDYVTFPAMFKWGRKISPDLIITFSFLLMGLWHGIGVNWLFFGLFNALMIYLFNVSNRRGNFPLVGFFLSFCIWVGNGTFQHQDFFQRITAPFHLIPDFKIHDINLPIFLTAISLLLVLEFFQEKKKESDFFTSWPVYIKAALFLLFAFWLRRELGFNGFYHAAELPPVYFRI